MFVLVSARAWQRDTLTLVVSGSRLSSQWRLPVSLRFWLSLTLSSCSLVGYDGHAPIDLTDTDAGDLDASTDDGDASISVKGDGATTLDSGKLDAGTLELDARTDERNDASERDVDGSEPGDDASAVDGRVLADASTDLPPTINPEPDAALPDASVPPDSGRDAGRADGGATDAGTCAGSSALGMCWYLGGFGTSCNGACFSHGGVDVRQASVVGTSYQGGTRANCSKVLVALRIAAIPQRGYREDNVGMGCHVWVDGSAFWIDPVPAYNPASASWNGRAACACLR